MSYLVVGPDGSKYGPADQAVLQEWIAQNRLTSATELEDPSTGKRVFAGTLPELRFYEVNPPYRPQIPQDPMNPNPVAPPPTPSPTPYFRPASGTGAMSKPEPIAADKVIGIILICLGGLIGIGALFFIYRAATVDPNTLPRGSESQGAIFGFGLGLLLMALFGGAIGDGIRRGRKQAFLVGAVLYGFGTMINLMAINPLVVIPGALCVYCILRLAGKIGPKPA